MAISVLSSSYEGIESYIVEVEVDISKGLPVFNIVGMGDIAILESKERIKSCFKNMDLEFPVKRVLVNLSPADVKKKGSHFDLPIFMGILAGAGKIMDIKKFDDYLIIGEISLNGKIKPVKGVINATILAKEKGIKGIIIPKKNYNEARLISGVEIIPVEDIVQVKDFFNKELKNNETVNIDSIRNIKESGQEQIQMEEDTESENLDFCDVKGQLLAKRAMEIAAAGGHNIFLIGDPGSGKSMMAKRFNTILPDMTEEEIIETTKIYSISGMLSEKIPVIMKRPFRAPHHTATQTALVGGATRVGEITLAINGVFFLDELGEFGIKTLETLRQPLEDGSITISRANSIITYPVKNITIMASNPSPSGFFPEDPQCKDSLRDIKNYQKRFSGPLLDRVDMYVEMRRLKKEEMMENTDSEKSEAIKERVMAVRNIQKKRFGNMKLNSKMSRREIVKYCSLDKETSYMMEEAIEKLSLSVRAYDKILKVSRTIADLEGSDNIRMEHLMEALNYRKKY